MIATHGINWVLPELWQYLVLIVMMAADLGTDVGGFLDVDPEGKMVSGRRCLAEAAARRLITPRGRLIDDPNYGTDVREYLNDDMGPADLALMFSAVIAECLKDERVVGADVTGTFVNGAVTLNITLTDGDGPFSLVLSVSVTSVTVQLLTVQP